MKFRNVWLMMALSMLIAASCYGQTSLAVVDDAQQPGVKDIVLNLVGPVIPSVGMQFKILHSGPIDIKIGEAANASGKELWCSANQNPADCLIFAMDNLKPISEGVLAQVYYDETDSDFTLELVDALGSDEFGGQVAINGNVSGVETEKNSDGLLHLRVFSSSSGGLIPLNLCDINADGKVNIQDIIQTVRMYMSLSTCTLTACNFLSVISVANAFLGKGCSLSGGSGGPHSVVLTWDASSSVGVSYNVYRSNTSGGPYTKINGGAITVLTYTDLSVSPGQTYYYTATAQDGGGVEGGYSNEASATIPSP